MFRKRSPVAVSPPSRRAQKELMILNRTGLHAAPARGFVLRVMQHRSKVTLWAEGREYAGSRIMDLLSGRFRYRQAFTLIAEGPDAEETLESLEAYLLELARGEEAAPASGYVVEAFDF